MVKRVWNKFAAVLLSHLQHKACKPVLQLSSVRSGMESPRVSWRYLFHGLARYSFRSGIAHFFFSLWSGECAGWFGGGWACLMGGACFADKLLAL